MILRKLSVSNFKTLNLNQFELKNYSIVIGPNGAGKSNLVALFSFIADCIKDGLDAAVSRQGGTEYLLNLNSDSTTLTLDLEFQSNIFLHKTHYLSNPVRVRYHLDLELTNMSSKVISEKITFENIVDESGSNKIKINEEIFEFVQQRLANPESSDENYQTFQFRSFSISRDKDGLFELSEPNQPSYKLKELIKVIDSFMSNKLMKKNYLMLSDINSILQDPLAIIRTYDFDTRTLKQSGGFRSENYLATDGANLINILRALFADPKQKKRFLNLYQSFLSFVQSTEIKKSNTSSSSYELYLKESYNENPIPSNLISDGTMSIIAIIIALYFEESDIVVIEEPEKYIHPALIEKIASSIVDASIYKQLIITTHNPELLKHIDQSNIIFIKRDINGLSDLFYPSDQDSTRAFLENNLGIDDLFVNNLLGVSI